MSDRMDVISKLRTFEERISQILNLIGDKRTVDEDQKAELQRLLKNLKSDLGNEARRGETIRGAESLSELESAYLMPAVSQAIGEIRVATNSHPINSDWSSELYAARIDILFFLRQLESQ